jgi:hypothetical protein
MKWSDLQGDRYAYDGRGAIVASVKKVSCGYYVISPKRGGFALDVDGAIAWYPDAATGIAALENDDTVFGWAGFGYGQPTIERRPGFNGNPRDEDTEPLEDAA